MNARSPRKIISPIRKFSSPFHESVYLRNLILAGKALSQAQLNAEVKKAENLIKNQKETYPGAIRDRINNERLRPEHDEHYKRTAVAEIGMRRTRDELQARVDKGEKLTFHEAMRLQTLKNPANYLTPDVMSKKHQDQLIEQVRKEDTQKKAQENSIKGASNKYARVVNASGVRRIVWPSIGAGLFKEGHSRSSAKLAVKGMLVREQGMKDPRLLEKNAEYIIRTQYDPLAKKARQ